MNKLRYHIIAAAVALCAAPAALAVPAYPGLIKVTQPDGTELEVRLRGDEHGHFMTTADNHLVIEQNGEYFYARPSGADAKLMSTGIRATDAALRSAEVKAMLSTIDANPFLESFKSARMANVERMAAAREAAQTRTAAAPASRASNIPEGTSMLTSKIPNRGKHKGLVILVEYQDVKFLTPDPLNFFKRMMMEKDFNEYGFSGSANQFFYDSSRGQYDPQFDVYGPVTLSQDMKYYGSNINNIQGQDANPHMMVIEAVKALDPEVDFSQYDTDGDGAVDNVSIIYAGEGEATSGASKNVWPHAAYIQQNYGITCKADGVLIDHYNCINEWLRAKSRPAGLGTFVHEFSHILGLPDLYDTDYQLEKTITPGYWSVMDIGPYNNNGLTPPLHSCYEAYCLGWVNPAEINEPSNVTLKPGNGECVYVGTDSPNEFFMFEARFRDNNVWDSYLPADGLLVWHIDYNERIWKRNVVNNTADHLRIDLIKADNKPYNDTANGDAFPGRTNRYTEFSADTEPAFLAWSGYDMELPITDITRGNGVVTFKVDGGGKEVGIEDIAADNSQLPVEWFTLQGVRVAQPQSGNIYIRRQGSDVAKQLVK